MQYALKIRKSDLALLAILNGGLEPAIEKTPTYLIIDTDGPNEIVTERDLAENYEFNQYSPLLLELKK